MARTDPSVDGRVRRLEREVSLLRIDLDASRNTLTAIAALTTAALRDGDGNSRSVLMAAAAMLLAQPGVDELEVSEVNQAPRVLRLIARGDRIDR